MPAAKRWQAATRGQRDDQGSRGGYRKASVGGHEAHSPRMLSGCHCLVLWHLRAAQYCTAQVLFHGRLALTSHIILLIDFLRLDRPRTRVRGIRPENTLRVRRFPITANFLNRESTIANDGIMRSNASWAASVPGGVKMVATAAIVERRDTPAGLAKIPDEKDSRAAAAWSAPLAGAPDLTPSGRRSRTARPRASGGCFRRTATLRPRAPGRKPIRSRWRRAARR